MSTRVATTQWSQVLAARDGTGVEAREALEGLCRTYWPPLYAFARSRGNDPEEAEDLTQGFFAYLLDKKILQRVDPAIGRFRSFLFASIQHYVAHQHRADRALKRGGGSTTISFDSAAGERSLAAVPTDALNPERAFEYRWGLTVLELAIARLREECEERGTGRLCDSLLPHLTGQEPRVPLRDIARQLDMSETAARGAMYRLRQRYGQLIREEIAQTLAEPADVDAEVRHLLAVIKPWEAVQS